MIRCKSCFLKDHHWQCTLEKGHEGLHQQHLDWGNGKHNGTYQRDRRGNPDLITYETKHGYWSNFFYWILRRRKTVEVGSS